MVNINVFNLWAKATAGSICREHDCVTCHSTYEMDRCPLDANVTCDEMTEFIKRVTKTLRKLDEETPFDLDISDEELINILKQAADVDNQGSEHYIKV